MNGDFGVAGLRTAWLDPIGVITLGGIRLGFGSIRYDSEARNRSTMATGVWSGELASRHSLLPGPRFEMMVVTHGVGQLGFEILQLFVSIVVE